MKTFNIYFNDLNDDAKKRLLNFVGEKDASDMNWDLDIIPIAIFDYEGVEALEIIKNDPSIDPKYFERALGKGEQK